jgi:hypothetical protein
MLRSIFSALLSLAITSSTASAASYKIQVVRNQSASKVVSVQKATAPLAKGQRILLRSIHRFLPEGAPPSPQMFQEFLADEAAVPTELKKMADMRSRLQRQQQIPGAEVRTLVQQGPKENRINLTIVGDGYTLSQKEKFFADALRTTKGLFTGQTFASYLPLFNVYAVFVPSNVSGIGDGSPKDTALRLYREPKGSKRGIMPGDPGAADRAIALAPATDYPILLANDDFYGGLGGQYAISTSSVRTGLIVLRHELGHNFGNVGEEYDGGYVYSGANASSSSSAHWSYWADGGLSINEALNLGGEYMWKNLASGPVSMNFDFPKAGPNGPYSAAMLLSTVGWDTQEDVAGDVDGMRIPIRGTFHEDRNFYELGPVQNFKPGQHTVRFTEKINDGNNVLAYVRLYAFPPNYDFTPNRVGAYLNYNVNGRKAGYRPTHNGCLMRKMEVLNFCVVDQENMWHRFLDRVSLIDDVIVGAPQGSRDQRMQMQVLQGQRFVTLKAPKLKGFSVAWFKVDGGNETELGQLRDQLAWKVPQNLTGNFKVKVKFVTPEVRKYNKRFAAEKAFSL